MHRKKKKLIETVSENTQAKNLLNTDCFFKQNYLKYAQLANRNHGQTTKGNQENNVSPSREYQ